MVAPCMRDRVLLHLEGIANTDLLGIRMLGEELIIVTATATDTMTMHVENDARNKHEVNRTVISESLRLRHTQTTFLHHILAVVGTNLHRVTMGNRENKRFLTGILGEQRT